MHVVFLEQSLFETKDERIFGKRALCGCVECFNENHPPSTRDERSWCDWSTNAPEKEREKRNISSKNKVYLLPC